MICPRCQSQKFDSLDYEGVEVDRCQNCHGLWLDEGEILEIVDIKEKDFSEELVKETVSQAFSGIPLIERETILKCPKCKSSMNPVNYAVSSGVIIDRCPKNCGLWFDKNELEKVQAYREYWQDEMQNKREAFTKILAEKSGMKEENSHSILFTVATFFGKFTK